MKFMKSIILPCVAALNLCASELVVNFFELTNAPGKFENFRRLGEENIVNSLEKERGTLAMMCVSRADDENSHFVFEIYADEAAYAQHRASAHFGRFLEGGAQILTDKKQIAVTSNFIGESELIRSKILPASLFNLVKISIAPQDAAKFSQIVNEEMRETIKKEPNVLAIYALNLKDEPNEWIFFEIYADEAAYEAHRQTPHFRAYIEQSKDMVVRKEFIKIKNLISLSKGAFAG